MRCWARTSLPDSRILPHACSWAPAPDIKIIFSRRGVTSRLHALYGKLGVEQYQLETDTWGQTFSLRILAIRLALRRGLLNRVILDDEAA